MCATLSDSFLWQPRGLFTQPRDHPLVTIPVHKLVPGAGAECGGGNDDGGEEAVGHGCHEGCNLLEALPGF